MSSGIVQTIQLGSEAGKLQSELQSVFRRMLSQTRTIDSSMSLGEVALALGELRKLEAYLERGLEILSRPLEESGI